MRALPLVVLICGCGLQGVGGQPGPQGPQGNEGPAGACVTPAVNVSAAGARSGAAGRWTITFSQPSVGPATCDGFAHLYGPDMELKGHAACRIQSVGERSMSILGEISAGRLLLSIDYSGSILLADLVVSGSSASGTSGTVFASSGVGPLGASSSPYTITMAKQ